MCMQVLVHVLFLCLCVLSIEVEQARDLNSKASLDHVFLVAFGPRDLPMAEEQAIRGVLREWQEDDHVCNLGTRGLMAMVSGKDDIGRKDVCRNAAVIRPVVIHLGP